MRLPMIWFLTSRMALSLISQSEEVSRWRIRSEEGGVAGMVAVEEKAQQPSHSIPQLRSRGEERQIFFFFFFYFIFYCLIEKKRVCRCQVFNL